MSPELYPNMLLDAVNAVKVEVATLTSSLQSVEDRVGRLETAAYTPAATPMPLDFDFQQHPQEPISEQAESSSKTETSLPGTRPYDIELQLRPINDGIVVLKEHLARLDQFVSEQSAEQPGTPNKTTHHRSSVVVKQENPDAIEHALVIRNAFKTRQLPERPKLKRRISPTGPKHNSPPNNTRLVRTHASFYALRAKAGEGCENTPFCISTCHKGAGRASQSTWHQGLSNSNPFHSIPQMYPGNPYTFAPSDSIAPSQAISIPQLKIEPA